MIEKSMIQKLKIKKPSKPMMIMLISMLILFGSIFAFQAFQGYMMKRFLTSSKGPPISVSAMEVKYETWLPRIKATGSVRAINGVDVTTESAGLVRSIHFAPGAEVKKGDALVELNADLEMAQLRSLIASAELAKIVYERDKAQFAISAVSQATLDADEANMKSTQAQVEAQAATIAKKTIWAPFDGRLGVSLVNLGQYLNPGDKVVTLQSFDPIFVDFFLPQQKISQIELGQTVSIISDSFPDQTFIGKITTIDPKADPSTRNIQVEATIRNPDHQLLPGMFASVEVNIGKPERYLTLPQTAISYNPYGEIVYIITSKEKDKKGPAILTVTQSFVVVGETRGDQIVVLKGVKEGDLIVTSGQLKLKNGSSVVINNTVVPSNDPAPQVTDE